MDALNKTFPAIYRDSQLLGTTPQSLEKIYDEIKREHTHGYIRISSKIDV